MQEHLNFVEQELMESPAFATPEEQVAWYFLEDRVLGVHINVVISPELIQCSHV